MALIVACINCGEGITVSNEELAEFTSKGIPLKVSHEVCPRDAVVLPSYRLDFIVTKIVKGDGGMDFEEKLTQVSSTVEAHSLTAALPEIQSEIKKHWDRISSLADIVE